MGPKGLFLVAQKNLAKYLSWLGKYLMLIKEITQTLGTGPVAELFAPNQAWNWTMKTPREMRAQFHVQGVPYVFAAHDQGHGSWLIEFAAGDSVDKGQVGITGTGNSARVMSTVTDILRSLLKSKGKHVQSLEFTSEEPSRTRLYAHMAQRLLPDWDLHMGYGDFIISRPEQL